MPTKSLDQQALQARLHAKHNYGANTKKALAHSMTISPVNSWPPSRRLRARARPFCLPCLGEAARLPRRFPLPAPCLPGWPPATSANTSLNRSTEPPLSSQRQDIALAMQSYQPINPATAIVTPSMWHSHHDASHEHTHRQSHLFQTQPGQPLHHTHPPLCQLVSLDVPHRLRAKTHAISHMPSHQSVARPLSGIHRAPP